MKIIWKRICENQILTCEDKESKKIRARVLQGWPTKGGHAWRAFMHVRGGHVKILPIRVQDAL